MINIQFHKKMSIIEVAFYLDYNLDESYTPSKISIRAGTTFHDLREVHTAVRSGQPERSHVPRRRRNRRAVVRREK